MQNLAEGEQGGDHHQNGDEQGVSEALHAAAASLQARYPGRKVLILILYPGLLHLAALAHVQLVAGEGPNVRRLDALENETDPAEAAELVDSRQRQHLGRVNPVIRAGT